MPGRKGKAEWKRGLIPLFLIAVLIAKELSKYKDQKIGIVFEAD